MKKRNILLVILLLLIILGVILFGSHKICLPDPPRQGDKVVCGSELLLPFWIHKVGSQLQSQQPSSFSQLNNVGILYVKDGDFYSLNPNDSTARQLTTLKTFTDRSFFTRRFSPDKTKLAVLDKNQNLFLITRDSTQLLLKNVDWRLAWRSDGNGLLIVKNEDLDPNIPVKNPTTSTLFTYDLATKNLDQVAKVHNHYVSPVIWDNQKNIVGYSLPSGDGGDFGEYHVIDLQTKKENVFKNDWLMPDLSADGITFIVWDLPSDSAHSSLFLTENPNQAIRDLAQRGSPYFHCVHAADDMNCANTNNELWVQNYKTDQLSTFDMKTGKMSDITQLPRGSKIIDVAKDQNSLLLLMDDNQYALYDIKEKETKVFGIRQGDGRDVVGFLY